MKKEYKKPYVLKENIKVDDIILVSTVDETYDWSVEADITFD